MRGHLGLIGARFLSLGDVRPRSAAMIADAQQRQLRRILRTLASTAIGRRFALANITDVACFQARVPITTYADYADELQRCAHGEANVMFPGRVVALAQTSGTTSAAQAGERFIPQGRHLLRQHARGAAASLSRLAAASGAQLFSGQTMMLGGSTALTPNAHGVPSGDLSGIVIDQIPAWLEPFYEPGRGIALESNWERKIARIVERCATRRVTCISGIPSWMLVLFDALCRDRGVSSVNHVWPQLRGMIHGGHAIAPVLPLLRHHLDPACRLMEVYPASEGFLAVGSRAWSITESEAPPLEVLCNHGIYLEFSDDERGTVVGAENLEDGRLYRVLMTTLGGLLRYQVGDVVRGCGPGQLRVTGRVKTRISVFGEHVEGDKLDAALSAACAGTASSAGSAISVTHYHVAPVLPSPSDGRGRHEWWIEFAGTAPDTVNFAAQLDHWLLNHVLDYAGHRAGDLQLTAPTVIAVPTGTFHAFLAAKGKLGGQHKVPQAWPDRTFADHLAALLSAHSARATTPTV